MASFRWGVPLSGGRMQGGMKKSRLSTNIRLYLRTDAKQSHSYYGRRIRNITQTFEWYQFEWSWVTSNPNFKVMTSFNVKKTRKRYKTELYLQWLTNIKPYMIYRTAPFSMTLNDLYPQFQGHAILWRWISHKRYDIRTEFQWTTDRDLYTHYSTVSMSDLEWLSKIFNDMTCSVARSLCDSWASC